MVAYPSDSSPPSPALMAVIQANLEVLPPEQQQQVADFVEFLTQKTLSAPSPKTIWEQLDERMDQLPDEVWEDSPTDGSYQHDHYLYGTPKREL